MGRQLLALTSGCIAIAATPVHARAQGRAVIGFFHGSSQRTNHSRVYNLNKGSGDLAWSDNVVSLYQKPGDSVCVHIVNAHPIKYTYSLDAKTDTASPQLPDFSSYASLLGPLVAAAKSGAKKVPAESLIAKPILRLNTFEHEGINYVRTDPIALMVPLLDSLRDLANEIDSASNAVRQSDEPETLDEALNPPLEPRAGFLYASYYMRSLSTARYRFGDKDLSKHLTELIAEAQVLAKNEPSPSLFALSLKAYGQALLEGRDALRKSYLGVSPDVRLCKNVSPGTTTIGLHISRKDTSQTAIRDFGNEGFVTLVVHSSFPRQLISLSPIAFLAHASSVPQFQVISDTLRAPSQETNQFRVGAMLTLNAASWGEDRSFGIAPGIGFGAGGGGKVLSDFLVGLTVAYRNDIRVGFGTGISQFPTSVKGGVVGRPLPADGGKLSDLIQTDWKWSFYILFSLPGINLTGTK